MPLSKVIVVGAGPSGLLLTLMLARSGVHVDLLEMTNQLDTNPRASHYGPAATYELDRAGVLDDIREQGFIPEQISWRKLDEQKTVLCKILRTVGIEERHRTVCLPLHRLGKILENHVRSYINAKILYGHRVVALGQDAEKAWVDVETPLGNRRMNADYIVGCDGANSKIRLLLFGVMNFPGFTWDRQIVATNMYYDFSSWKYDDSQFFIHPQHYHMVARIQPDGMYRVSYGEVAGLSTEQLWERLAWKYETMLPGHPKPEQYKVVNFSPYKIHQRCAERFRVGKFVLAADAAHLCNPFGGMGLTGGIADIGSLYDSLLGIHAGQADDSILDIYDEVRRRIWHEIINPVSSENIKRLFDQDADEALDNDPFLRQVKNAETDPALAAQMQARSMSLRYDMTQHYDKSKAGVRMPKPVKVLSEPVEVR